jgi:hypothetical protein
MFVLATYTCTVGALTTALAALCATAAATTLAMNIVLLMWWVGAGDGTGHAKTMDKTGTDQGQTRGRPDHLATSKSLLAPLAH